MPNAFAAQVVASPARTPAPYGLFSVLAFREPLDQHWEGGGVQWQSIDGSKTLGVVGAPQLDPAETTGQPKTFALGDDTDSAGVFTLYGQQRVTPIGWSAEDARERARLMLLSFEERTVEAVLSGEVGSLTPNMGSATPFASSSDLTEVLALLEEFLADNYGSRGVIHLSRGNSLHALKYNALETRGNGLFTKLGTPVVAGQGYPSDVAFATSALVGYRSEVFEDTRMPYDLLDKGKNDLYAIAERTYSLGFEDAALGAVTIGDSPA